MSWLWYGTELTERVAEYREEAAKRLEKYHGTYTQARDAIDIADRLEENEGDPKELLSILRDGLQLASDASGSVPLLDDYLTLLSHAADAGIQAIDDMSDRKYKTYKLNREHWGKSHEEALPPHDGWSERFRTRYELEKLKKEARNKEPPTRECDDCGDTRPVDRLYDCNNCGDSVCYWCRWTCDADGDHGNYCSDCWDHCTHCRGSFCDDHLTACPADGKRYCDSYLGECAVGGETRCLRHLTECNDCGDLLCEEHEGVCGGCNARFGEACLQDCAGCSEQFCEECFEVEIETDELVA